MDDRCVGFAAIVEGWYIERNGAFVCCMLEISGVSERLFLYGRNYLYFDQSVGNKLLSVEAQGFYRDFVSKSAATCLAKYYQIAVEYIIMLFHSGLRLDRLIQTKTDF